MPSVKGTKTERNLLISFAGESQARNRYTYFAGQARKEGYVQIAEIFAETADQEKEHAKRFFSYLEGGELKIEATFPAGVVGTTAQNLKTSAAGEHHEHTEMYPGFAKIAKDEGFEEIELLWRNVSNAEAQHEKRYLGLLSNLEKGRVFKRENKVAWRCRNCGFVAETVEAPKTCPACAHPQAHFELLCENW